MMKGISLYNWTIASLSVFAGGCITILFIILPYWQSLDPQDLMQWFTDFGPRTGITMLPMEAIPLALSVYAYFWAKNLDPEGKKIWIWVNISNILILLMFFIYFLPVNMSFANQTINLNDVSSELRRWKMIHTARTILSVLSTVLALHIASNYTKNTR